MRAHQVLDPGVVVEKVAGHVLSVSGDAETAVGHFGDERQVGVGPYAAESSSRLKCAARPWPWGQALDRSGSYTGLRRSAARRVASTNLGGLFAGVSAIML